MNAIELKKGCDEFRKHEPRDAMYRTATFLIDHFWGKQREMSDALGVLLLTWNQAFYRYGLLDFEVLENCLIDNWKTIESLRDRNILSYSPTDDDTIGNLYNQFLESLQIAEGKSKGRKSPVSVAKSIHLLAPASFPLWDYKIAVEYKCQYDYIPFIRKMKVLAEALSHEIDVQKEGRTLLKMIDEYNYARYT
jgi:hypothetical protein